MPQFDVIGIGVNVVDVLVQMPSEIQFGDKQEAEDIVIQGGGPSATASCVCSSLGWRTGYVTKMGENTLSRIARAEFQSRGVVPDLFVEAPSARPGVAMVQIDPQTAERTIFYKLAGYEALRATDLPREVLKDATVLIIDGYEPEAAEAALETVRNCDCHTVIDLEIGEPDVLHRMLTLATDAILPLAAGRTITGKETPEKVLEALAQITEAQLVITDGIAGSWALTSQGIIHQAAFHVKAVDTTGCGDVFHGAYAAGLLEGMELAECLEFATWIASIIAQRVGGRAALPSRNHLAALDLTMLSESLRAIVAKMAGST
jgi:sugar/nucleoside kinase (ribokinase family)